MQIKKAQGVLSWVVILSEISHVFCCVLPSVFSLLTILVGMGVLGAMPTWMNGLHDVMHDWEIPVIIASAVVLFLGWSLHFISKAIDCRDTGCGHEPCAPKKNRTQLVLIIATLLFAVNVTIYMTVHVSQDNAAEAVGQDDHHGHDHHDH